MPVQALTQQFTLDLSAYLPKRGAVCFFDIEIKGFLLELRPSGGATFYFRYRDSGGQVRLSKIGRLKELDASAARSKAYHMHQLLMEGGDPKQAASQQKRKRSPAFSDFVEQRYLPHAKACKRSWRTDESLLKNHLLPTFGAVGLDRISRSDVIAFHHSNQQKGYASGSCNRMLVLLQFMLNCAVRWDLLAPSHQNPCLGVGAFEDNGARERFLTVEEVQRLFAELDRNRNVMVGQVIKLLLFTGARKREVLDARWDDVDFERQLLTVPAARSKSKKVQYIALSDAAVTLLQDLPRTPGVPWVFVNPKTLMPPVSIFYAWDSIRQRVGLADLRLHDLRHSYASFLVNAGRSLYEVQKLLGHHDPKVTMRYAHLSPKAMLEAANVVGNLVAPTPVKNRVE